MVLNVCYSPAAVAAVVEMGILEPLVGFLRAEDPELQVRGKYLCWWSWRRARGRRGASLRGRQARASGALQSICFQRAGRAALLGALPRARRCSVFQGAPACHGRSAELDALPLLVELLASPVEMVRVGRSAGAR